MVSRRSRRDGVCRSFDIHGGAELPSNVTQGETVEITQTVQATGDAEDYGYLSLWIDGERVGHKCVKPALTAPTDYSTGSTRARVQAVKKSKKAPPLSPALVSCPRVRAPAQASKKSKKWCVRRPRARVVCSERARHGHPHRRSEDARRRGSLLSPPDGGGADVIALVQIEDESPV